MASNQLRILVLNYEFPPLGGGAGNATHFLLEALAQYPDISVDLITSSTAKQRTELIFPNATGHFLDIGKGDNIHYQSNKELLTYSFKAYREAKKIIKEHPCDLVHAFFGIPCGFIAQHLGLPYIVSLRGSDVPFYNQRFAKLDRLIFQRLSRSIWRNAAFVIANSNGLQELATASAPSQPIRVIPNGVDTHYFTPAPARAQPIDLHLVSTGRLIARKGYSFLIEALSGLVGFSLTLVGDGNQRAALEEQSARCGVKTIFVGSQSREQVREYLRQADIFVLPSLNEGMSNSVLEAMACGLPIIATDVGGSDELIQGNGFIVAKESPSALRAALQHYRENPSLITTHAQCSRELALAMSWETVAAKYVCEYRAAVEK